MSDIGLLELTGANGIGRVQVVPEGLGLASAKDVEDMASVLASADSRDSLLGLRLLAPAYAAGAGQGATDGFQHRSDREWRRSARGSPIETAVGFP